jgi:hypothetical protein
MTGPGSRSARSAGPPGRTARRPRANHLHQPHHGVDQRRRRHPRLYVTGNGGQSWQQQAWAEEPAVPPAGLGIVGPQHHILAVGTPNPAQTGTLMFYAPAAAGPS